MKTTPLAVHLPDGNHFADMWLEIASSVAAQEPWLAEIPKRSIRRSRAGNYARLVAFILLRRLRLWEPAVNAGLVRSWFDEFADYWNCSLGGRPLTIIDFHQLRFHFRKRFSRLNNFSWDTSREHLSNWQTPENIHATFDFVYRDALESIRSWSLFKHLHSGMRVLEYGCSIAPMYRTWRRYLSHIPSEWVLADIPNFPFHYLRHTCADDRDVVFCRIDEEFFDDPLHNITGNFDIIIIHEVFEHLHKPRYLAEYLLRRMRQGALLFFDYARSEATGHDTPAGLMEREATLRFLANHLEILEGPFEISERSLGRCIGQLKSPLPATT